MADNKLYYRDNLTILRHTKPVYIPDESVDLVYLDPPFNNLKDTIWVRSVLRMRLAF